MFHCERANVILIATYSGGSHLRLTKVTFVARLQGKVKKGKAAEPYSFHAHILPNSFHPVHEKKGIMREKQ